jgi:hypothetical protein
MFYMSHYIPTLFSALSRPKGKEDKAPVAANPSPINFPSNPESTAPDMSLSPNIDRSIGIANFEYPLQFRYI